MKCLFLRLGMPLAMPAKAGIYMLKLWIPACA